MKKTIVAILAFAGLLSCANVFAQGKYGADSTECIKYLSYYQEYYKQKNYNDAYPNWEKAYQICAPTASQNLFIHGATIIKNKIAKTTDAAERAALIELLLQVYDVRVATYPNNAVTALNNKGLDVANYIKNDNQRLYDIFSDIIQANQEQTKTSLFVLHMNAAIELYKEGKIGTEDILGIYQNSLALIENAPAKDDAEAEKNGQAKTDLESLFISSKVASCDKLIELFTPRFENQPEDLDLVANIVKMMGMTEDCTDNDLYLNAATTLYRLSPSYTAAYSLYRLYSSRDKVQDAIKYMEEAIESADSDENTDAQFYYELATFCYKNGLSSKAYDSASKALALDENLKAKCYFLMGTIWGSISCSGNEIEKRAPYWVAVDYLQKAKAEDPSLEEDANKLISSFRAYFPSTADAFMYDITDNDSYTVSCGGMRATTTVRTQK